MVFRIYTEKKPGMSNDAVSLLQELRNFLNISAVENVRIFNRYDVEGIDRELFDYCTATVLSEPQSDNIYTSLPCGADYTIGVEYLPGQYDQRADSAAQCIQIISQKERPVVKNARIYQLFGALSESDINTVKKFLINAVESREASLDEYTSLETDYDIPEDVKILDGFISCTNDQLKEYLSTYSLAMDFDDILFCRDYFLSEKRNPTLTELRMIDTYWSDHCRHTTFNTIIDNAEILDEKVKCAYDNYIRIRHELNRTKPVTLMDIATIGAKYLKKNGYLEKLDESEEINACTVKLDVETEDSTEEYLILFKNETHNHPTEIEPFGGAATCIGGAIRDPLSGRSYVYQAMRVTGAADPLRPVSETIPGKLPQKKLVTTAANGYSSYGNQIGLATGLVDELYHDGYAAKRLEVGAVIGAAPRKNVVRAVPEEGDIVVLLGGRTGRDGCGGATGSSKSHTAQSLELCGAEVQKGNAPEERKLQRLFRNPIASSMIKRCNDFGAGGISVAIGELAEGLIIDLDKVPKKYEGLDGTELAISESQERMAVVLNKKDVDHFIKLSSQENLEATVVATVIADKRLIMNWRGKRIVDLSRAFLDTNGAEKHINVKVNPSASPADDISNKSAVGFKARLIELSGDLNICSKQGLAERFDSTIGAGSVLMPFGGKNQLTPTQVMAAKVPVLGKESHTCSVMAYGTDPFNSENNCYQSAYDGVIESVAKLICSGCRIITKKENCYFSFQEYFERLGKSSDKWGKPFASLLGALDAQLELKIAAIGGKDSMSGTFEDISVPPTLISFAVSFSDIDSIISPEFKNPDSEVYLLTSEMFDNDYCSLFSYVEGLFDDNSVLSAYTPGIGGCGAAIFKMCLGNGIGFKYENISEKTIFKKTTGSFILETNKKINKGLLLGHTTEQPQICYKNEIVALSDLQVNYEGKLESVFPQSAKTIKSIPAKPEYNTKTRRSCAIKAAAPKVVIPVFPGTNCEYDSARAFELAGGKTEIIVIRNLTQNDISDSAKQVRAAIDKAQILFIPGGFSGGDEPDGSGKFITAFFRNPILAEGITALLEKRDGLIGGICNGFQALIKLGLVPFGRIIEPDESCPTLTFNTIGRHVSRLITTRVASNMSPWYCEYDTDELHTMPVSHGEGRFVCSDELFESLVANGQISTQYVDPHGNPTMDIRYNPNGSYNAVEGITSPDGRIFGKMGHSERFGYGLYKNIPGINDSKLFYSGIKYFK